VHIGRLTTPRTIAAIAAGAAILAAGWLLTGSAEARRNPPAPAQPITSQAQQAVTVRDFSFTPNSFSAPRGEALMVTVTNSGPAPHTFTISGVVDSGSIPPGTSRTVQFTPAQAGNLTFFCTIHGQNVMSGQISVMNPATSPAQPSQQQPAPPPAVQQQPQQQPAAPPPRPLVMQPPSTGDAGLAH
jgi:plastocyanin